METTLSPREPRTIALLSPGWPPESMANGIVSYTATMAPALEALGVRVHVLTSRLMVDHANGSVRVFRPQTGGLRGKFLYRLDPHGFPQKALAKALLEEVRRLHGAQGLQLLELEESYGWARFLGKSPVPKIVRLHGPWFLNGIANGVAQNQDFHERDGWEIDGMVAADAITAPSRDVLRQALARIRQFGFDPPTLAEVIPNPVEPVAPPNRWDLQNCDRNRIVFVGRFDRHKGGDTMLQAFAHLVRQVPDTRLDFVGPDRGCADDRGRIWQFDEFLREKLGEMDRAKVTFHGFQPGPKAAELRKRALVTVVPSRYETFGIAAAEAMMAGCPCVVCASGALTELIQDGRNGLLARAGDGADVSEKVLALLRDPERAERLGRQATLDAHERYCPPVVARQTVDFYRRVLATPRVQANVASGVPADDAPASVSV